MILALGSLGIVAALNWQPLTLVDRRPRCGGRTCAVALSQVALIGCAAGSCVMITTVASSRKPAVIRRIAIGQYVVACAIAVATLVAFFRAEQMPEMAPEEYLRRNLAPAGPRPGCCRCSTCCWRSPSSRGPGCVIPTAPGGAVRCSSSASEWCSWCCASAFFLLRAVGNTDVLAASVRRRRCWAARCWWWRADRCCPASEDWFGARRELRTIQPLLAELDTRHPDVGYRGASPRPAVVPGRRADVPHLRISLYLEAIAAERVARAPHGKTRHQDERDIESPRTSPISRISIRRRFPPMSRPGASPSGSSRAATCRNGASAARPSPG